VATAWIAPHRREIPTCQTLGFGLDSQLVSWRLAFCTLIDTHRQRIGGPPKGPTMTLEELLRLYLRSRHVGREHAGQLASAVRSLSAWLSRPATTDDLSRDNATGWLNSLSPGLSAASVNRYRRNLLALWNFAADLEVCRPPRKVPRVTEPQRIPVAWSMDDFCRLLEAADQATGFWAGIPAALCWRAGLLLLWDTAARIGELLVARTSEFDAASATWLVPAEHRKGRRADKLYRLHPETVTAVLATCPEDRHSLWPFPSARRQVWPAFKEVLGIAGLPADRAHLFHCIRRTSESHAAAVMGIAWAAAATGHSEAVARASYVSPLIAAPPALVDVLPRPHSPTGPRFRIVG
jgi:integrase